MLKRGLKQFIIRTVVFFAILLTLQLGIFLFISHTSFFQKYLAIPGNFYFPFLQGLDKQNFLNSVFFVVIAFLLLRSKDIKKFHKYEQDSKETVMFSILALLSFMSHYLLKYLVKANLEVALQHTLSITALKYAFNLLFVIFLAFAVYNKKFIFSFFKKFYKDFAVFLVIIYLYYRLVWWFQDSWLFFSTTVGKVLYFAFSKLFDNVVFTIGSAGPILGVEGFYVGISKVCSGIDSLLYFISLFAIIIVTNWKFINKNRMLILLVAGAIGTFFVNILRVFLLVIIAVKFSPKFAVDVFHTNAGWMFFLAYFIILWHFGRKWVMPNE